MTTSLLSSQQIKNVPKTKVSSSSGLENHLKHVEDDNGDCYFCLLCYLNYIMLTVRVLINLDGTKDDNIEPVCGGKSNESCHQKQREGNKTHVSKVQTVSNKLI